MSRSRSLLLFASAAVFAASLTLAPRVARAQDAGQLESDWRQADREDHLRKMRLEFPHFVFDLRFGGYYPRVDSEPALGGKTPYADIFGTGAHFYLGAEFDWIPIRIPFIGAIGPGIGIGWTDSSAASKIIIPHAPNDKCLGTLNGCASQDDTGLLIFPLYGVVVFRVDEPMVRWGIPIVPWVKVGVDTMLWSAGTSIPKDFKTPAGKSVSSEGTTLGEHFAIGAALSLNWLDRDAVNRSRESSGVRDFYFFGEFTDFGLGVIGSDHQMRVGSASWVLGVSVDM